MTARELYDALTGVLADGGGDEAVEVFEVRSSCTMPVVGFNIEAGDVTLLVDQADSE